MNNIHELFSKESHRPKLQQAREHCTNRVHSDQMVLWTVRWEDGHCERRPKALKTKLAQGEPSGSTPLRSDGSCDGQAGGWTS